MFLVELSEQRLSALTDNHRRQQPAPICNKKFIQGQQIQGKRAESQSEQGSTRSKGLTISSGLEQGSPTRAKPEQQEGTHATCVHTPTPPKRAAVISAFPALLDFSRHAFEPPGHRFAMIPTAMWGG